MVKATFRKCPKGSSSFLGRYPLVGIFRVYCQAPSYKNALLRFHVVLYKGFVLVLCQPRQWY